VYKIKKLKNRTTPYKGLQRNDNNDDDNNNNTNNNNNMERSKGVRVTGRGGL
jgi:hypothetical protein